MLVLSKLARIAPAARCMSQRAFASAASSQPLKQTALHDFHVKNGGKMVEFAGWAMPVQYSSLGVLASHMWTRQKASLFDVSHMLQTRWTGKDRTKFLESLVVADVEGLPVGSSTLSLFTNENGGIIDDTVVNKQDDKGFYVVSNAGCAEKDLAHIHAHLKKFQDRGGDVDVKVLEDVSLVALQGPSAAQVISALSGQNLASFGFMSGRWMDIKGIPVYISRCGYTGEDGFEISVPHEEVVRFSQMLLDHPDVELAGLGARDSLRLEAGLCLYGHDLDDTVTPVEGGLTWTIGKRRREEGGFLGADKIIPQIGKAVPRRRVGLVVEGAPAREGAEIFNVEGESIGKITSGCPSPVLKKNIAMGYVKNGFHKQGTELQVKVRNRMQKAKITKMPFVPQK
ncbi:aminomethyltransferase [Spizellomyces sp. 'palustris']|nr:aminomethyltransferase [Spizellomyces sp. 'palustris']